MFGFNDSYDFRDEIHHLLMQKLFLKRFINKSKLFNIFRFMIMITYTIYIKTNHYNHIPPYCCNYNIKFCTIRTYVCRAWLDY